jgi:hypothetical protein
MSALLTLAGFTLDRAEREDRGVEAKRRLEARNLERDVMYFPAGDVLAPGDRASLVIYFLHRDIGHDRGTRCQA